MFEDAYDVEDGYPPDSDHGFVWRKRKDRGSGTEEVLSPWCEEHHMWVHSMTVATDLDEGDLLEWLRENRAKLTARCENQQVRPDPALPTWQPSPWNPAASSLP